MTDSFKGSNLSDSDHNAASVKFFKLKTIERKRRTIGLLSGTWVTAFPWNMLTRHRLTISPSPVIYTLVGGKKHTSI